MVGFHILTCGLAEHTCSTSFSCRSSVDSVSKYIHLPFLVYEPMCLFLASMHQDEQTPLPLLVLGKHLAVLHQV